jgi:FkbM family methyltransferase
MKDILRRLVRARWERAVVIAIEPQQRLMAIIRENLSLNDLDNVVIEGSAISNKDGTASFYLSPDHWQPITTLYRPQTGVE